LRRAYFATVIAAATVLMVAACGAADKAAKKDSDD
jgi:uncharacterized lipoprotein